MTEQTPAGLQPDDAFIGALENQLREGIRRRAALDPTATTFRRKGLSMLASASLMLASLILGASGTYAVVHQDLAPYRALHLQKAAIQLERAQARLTQRHADLAATLPLVEQGVADTALAAQSQLQVAKAETEVRRREIDLRETEVTGRAPADDLSSPLVGDEDFVMQRLETQLQVIELERRRAQEDLSRVELRVRNGIAGARELGHARADLERVATSLTHLQRRLELRRAFVGGEMAPERIEVLALMQDAESDYEQAEIRLDAAQRNLQLVAALFEHGTVTQGELRDAETEVRDAGSERALAAVQLELIRQRLEAVER